MIRVLSPVNGLHEIGPLIEAGAGEVYCGVMPAEWRKSYSNVASPNRREWSTANLTSFDEVAQIVATAHAHAVPVFLTMNALYTAGQYGQVQKLVDEAVRSGVDAVIVADLGLLLRLREMGWQKAIHVSTGGTTFNDETVAFYRDLGAARVILPRQNRVTEIAALAAHNRDIELETFVMNAGCMNIDGFCTHHHGTKELRMPLWWNLPKKLHCDHYLLTLMRRLPARLRTALSRSAAGSSDSACFLGYDLDIRSDAAGPAERQNLQANLRRNFTMFTGADTCGACALWHFEKAGIVSVKIVGRNNPLSKKLADVRFLSGCLRHLRERNPSQEDFVALAQRLYRETFGFACHEWCYFPAADLPVGADVL